MGRTLAKFAVAAGVAALVGSLALLGGIVLARPELDSGEKAAVTYLDKQADEELAYLLVKLELRTRAVIGGHYTRPQARMPGVDFLYKRWVAKNAILPAAVADRVFSEVVPAATGGRAWAKMVVERPRNPNNQGDPTALEMLKSIQAGAAFAERSTSEAYYYGEPIKATETCLPCHGEPEGDPDPVFPQFEKNGWSAGDIVGAVIARVEPEAPIDEPQAP